MDMNLSKLQETVEDRGVWASLQTAGHNLATEQQNTYKGKWTIY